MRLAPSFLFSLLMLLSIFCGQVAASASSDGLESDGLLAHHPIVTIDEDFLEELAEVEEDDETEFAELTAHGGNTRQLLALLACGEDRSAEMYWPPEPIAVQVVSLWAPPSTYSQAHLSPAPGQLLRPPRPSLLG